MRANPRGALPVAFGVLLGTIACSDSRDVTPGAPDAGALISGADSWSAPDPALQVRLQAALVTARAEQDLPGLAMAVAYRDTRELWVSATGFSDLSTQTPWLPADESRIGSVTKTFTAAIIMQLAEQGVLSLKDHVESWVHGWYEGPTLRQLLNHTSGIASYSSIESFDMSRAWTPAELVQWAFDHEPELRFPPGTQWEYSNTNYVLLGMVIEAATGDSYEEALRTRLFEPLRLDMRLAGSGDDSPRLVRCYAQAPPVDASDAADPSFGWSAGAIVSTPVELARWIVALYGGELLSAASTAAMTTPNRVTAANEEKYGLGTIIEQDLYHGLTRVGHGGGIGGYMTLAYYLQQRNVALIVMSNWAQADLSLAANHGWAAVLEDPPPTAKP